jgi:phospholipid/cholesterol/gamma-HCH transport system permease protein
MIKYSPSSSGLSTALGFLSLLGDYTYHLFLTIKAIFTGSFNKRIFIEQLYTTGVLSLPVVSFTGFATGLVLAAQSFFQLSDKGLAEATGLMVAKAMATELGPVLTAFMITGRVGASMCAEIGTMKVSEQIDALRSMGISPINHLIAPRMLAGLCTMPILTIFSNALGVWGAYLVSTLVFGMSKASFLDPIPLSLNCFDVLSGLIKSFFFAILIISVCCYKGIKTRGGAAGVGQSTTQSVVICYSLILSSNFLLTLAMNQLYSLLPL